jgi:hypothetical protein
VAEVDHAAKTTHVSLLKSSICAPAGWVDFLTCRRLDYLTRLSNPKPRSSCIDRTIQSRRLPCPERGFPEGVRKRIFAKIESLLARAYTRAREKTFFFFKERVFL